VIGNTWAWSMRDNRGARMFSGFLGGAIGRRLIQNRNLFVERILPGGTRERRLPDRIMDQYRGPFPTPASRVPVAVFPKEIIAATPWLEEVEARVKRTLADRPALLTWPTADVAFREPERERWEQIFPRHETVLLDGACHYIGEDAPDEIVDAVGTWVATR